VSPNIISQGLTNGSIYALVGCSFNLIYRPTNVFNFAQGDLVMLGAMFAATAITVLSAPWFVGLVVVVVLTAAVALIEERVAISPVLRRSASSITWVITTLAFSIIIENIVGKFWGANPRPVKAPPGVSLKSWHVHGALVSPYDIFLFVIVLFIVLGLESFGRTRQGRAIAAVAEDRDAAMLRGIDPRKLTMWSLIAGGAVAGLTGLLAAPLYEAGTGLGAQLLIAGFEAAAIGGVGSYWGCLPAGYAIGLVEAFGASQFAPGYRSLASFLLLLVVLLVRPQGIRGDRELRHV
jgi:branched-chain amino acid transport system permease protein